jgi:CRISPR system Cascade subunit CasA
MSSFKLVHEQWIPCQLAAGPPQELSLREVFGRAADIRAIADASPLATAAMYRLLIAVAQRTLAGGDGAWSALWDARDIRAAEIVAYLDKWAHRFDLFDAERPFYQVAGLDPELANTVAKLTHERNAGANAALFDHSLDDTPDPLSPAEAARALLATHAFAAGGLLTFEKGQAQDRSADAAPLVKAAVVVLSGVNLAETILLNLFRIDAEIDKPFPHDPEEDRPAWERNTPTRPADRRPDGPLDLLTWQSRRVLLIAEERDGRVVVPRAVIMKGFQFPGGFSLADSEPMVAFRLNPKPAPGQEPKPPLGFRPDRALWRDSLALLESTPAGDKTYGRKRPKTLDDAARRLINQGESVRLQLLGIHLYGLGVDRAKLLLWRHEQFQLPLAYMDGPTSPSGAGEGKGNLVRRLDRSVDLAETVGSDLGYAASDLAKRVLSPESNPDPDRVKKLVEALAPGREYWAALDPHFRRFLIDLADAFETGDAAERAVCIGWAADVARAAQSAFGTAARSADASARGMRAAAEAQGLFDALLSRAFAAYTADLPQEVPV